MPIDGFESYAAPSRHGILLDNGDPQHLKGEKLVVIWNFGHINTHSIGPGDPSNVVPSGIHPSS
jgi:hypothetical protein